MQAFTRLDGRAIPFPEENVDTDIIYPARFLLIMEKQGLGQYLFYDRRFAADGTPREESIFNRPENQGLPILIAGTNFGCGSSREQAVWALAGFGIRCVIAPSFGEIFHANCFKSGVLPIVLPQGAVTDLAAHAAANGAFAVDLVARNIRADARSIAFAVDDERRAALLEGRDEIDTILHDALTDIEQFESRHAKAQPWLAL